MNNHLRVALLKRGTLLVDKGAHGIGELEFREPVRVIVRPNRKIYIIDYQDNRIQVFQLPGN